MCGPGTCFLQLAFTYSSNFSCDNSFLRSNQLLTIVCETLAVHFCTAYLFVTTWRKKADLCPTLKVYYNGCSANMTLSLPIRYTMYISLVSTIIHSIHSIYSLLSRHYYHCSSLELLYRFSFFIFVYQAAECMVWQLQHPIMILYW